MNLILNWININNHLHRYSVSELLNSQKRYIAENNLKKGINGYLSLLKQSLRYLLYSINNQLNSDTAVVFYGDLKNKINAGAMIDKIIYPTIKNKYNIIDERYFYNTELKINRIFLLKFYYFIGAFLKSIPTILRFLFEKKITFQESIIILFYKNAFLSHLKYIIGREQIKFFVTYNDFLGLSAEISTAFQYHNKNIYHIQHGVLSEINYPGIANYYLLWGQASFNKALALGYEKEILHIIGSSCFPIKKTNIKPVIKKRLLFFSQTNLIELTGAEACSLAKLWIIECAKTYKNWEFIIRLHPSEINENYYQECSSYSNITIEVASKIRIEDSISACTVCATLWSGAALDVMIQEKPLIFFTPQGFNKNKEFVDLGCKEVIDLDELKELLDAEWSENYSNKFIEIQNKCLKHHILNQEASNAIAQFILNNELIKG